MTQILVGDKYVAKATLNNRANGIDVQDDIRIGMVDEQYVSIHVLKRGGTHLKIAVPRDFFHSNFENDRMHLVAPNRAYAMSQRPTLIFKGL